MKTITATPLQSREIARLIMVAMNYECCQYFAGDNHTLDEFEDMMTALVERTDSQYSHLNTLVALDGDDIAGICVSYDGGQLHQCVRRSSERPSTALAVTSLPSTTKPRLANSISTASV